MPTVKTFLRPVEEKDQSFMFDLFKSTQEAQALKQLPEKLLEQLLHSQFAIKEQSYASMYPDGENSIIELNNNPVGRLFVNTAADEIRIIDIIISPNSRSQGIGSSLLAKIISNGDTDKIPVRLHVAVDNIEAQSLYKRHGFIFSNNDGAHIQCEYLNVID